jgi:hypothetical protein
MQAFRLEPTIYWKMRKFCKELKPSPTGPRSPNCITRASWLGVVRQFCSCKPVGSWHLHCLTLRVAAENQVSSDGIEGSYDSLHVGTANSFILHPHLQFGLKCMSEIIGKLPSVMHRFNLRSSALFLGIFRIKSN